MAASKSPSVALLRSLRALAVDSNASASTRAFTTTTARHDAEVQVPKESYYRNPQPETAYVPRLEKRLARAGTPPIGSRRRRMAIASSAGIPFDQLPYQCFQEARKILIADRAEKLQKIALMSSRIQRLMQEDGAKLHRGGEAYKQKRIDSMKRELEHLKILADINDPNVKRRFEDGKGDMNKPIYRFLANRKWREYRRNIHVQRINQFRVVPDVTPHCDPILAPTLRFGRSNIIGPGDFVPSTTSLTAPKLHLQSFEKEARLLTIAIVDPDVPNLETDGFDSRCHFLASNIEITPTNGHVDLGALSESQLIVPYLPPWAQKGSPYHRLAVVIFQQKDNTAIDLAIAKKHVSDTSRTGFKLRSMITRHMLTPVSATLWRTKWDEDMGDVMNQLGVAGADVELKRSKVMPLPYKRRNPSTFR